MKTASYANSVLILGMVVFVNALLGNILRKTLTGERTFMLGLTFSGWLFKRKRMV
jgi:hypothetical protein